MKSSARKDIKLKNYDEHPRENSNRRNSVQHILLFMKHSPNCTKSFEPQLKNKYTYQQKKQFLWNEL